MKVGGYKIKWTTYELEIDRYLIIGTYAQSNHSIRE